jgi:hypothetical protein
MALDQAHDRGSHDDAVREAADLIRLLRCADAEADADGLGGEATENPQMPGEIGRYLRARPVTPRRDTM